MVVSNCKVVTSSSSSKKKNGSTDNNTYNNNYDDNNDSEQKVDNLFNFLQTDKLHLQKHVKQLLSAIWDLADLDRDGVLNKADYRVLYHKLYQLYHSFLSITENNQPVIITIEMEELDFEHDWEIDSNGKPAIDKKRFVQCFTSIYNKYDKGLATDDSARQNNSVANSIANSDTLLQAISVIEFTNFLNLIFSFVARTNKSDATKIYWRDDNQISVLARSLYDKTNLFNYPNKMFKKLRRVSRRKQVITGSNTQTLNKYNHHNAEQNDAAMTITILSTSKDDNNQKSSDLTLSNPFQMLDQVTNSNYDKINGMKYEKDLYSKKKKKKKKKKKSHVDQNNADDWVTKDFQILRINSKWDRKQIINRRVSPFASQQPVRKWPKGVKEPHSHTPGGVSTLLHCRYFFIIKSILSNTHTHTYIPLQLPLFIF